MLKHPLSEATFFVGLSISGLVSQSWTLWAFHGAVLIMIMLIQETSLAPVWNRIRHLVLFFPILLGMFLLSSVIFSNISFTEAGASGSFSMMRFLLSATVMGVYMERKSGKGVFQSLRSVWLMTGQRWRKVEDLFLFLGLTLRFFPSIHLQWTQLQSSKISLGMQAESGRWKQIASLMTDLPGFLIHQLKKADTTSLAMSLRGYGNQVPRGVAQFIPFGVADAMQVTILISSYAAVHHFATI